jgi:DegV family protein with EDD domain
MGRVAVVTDSSAYLLPDELAALGVVAVELQVVVEGQSYDEGTFDPERLAAALRAGTEVTTSRPSPAVFSQIYEAAASSGADAVVSIHLSGHLSGTVDAAALAAKESPIPVHVVDSGQLGMALGFAVRSAATVAREGGDAETVARTARERAASASSFIYVDTLAHLRRGGRTETRGGISRLPVKALLEVRDGRVVPADMVRTASRGLARLAELAVEAVDDAECDVAVQHLAGAERAAALAARVTEELAARGRQPVSLVVREVGAALGAHAGPGMVAVTVSPT